MTNNRRIERPGGFPRGGLRRKNRRLRRPPPLAEGKGGCRGESRQQNQRQQRDALCSGEFISPSSLCRARIGLTEQFLRPPSQKSADSPSRPSAYRFVRLASESPGHQPSPPCPNQNECAGNFAKCSCRRCALRRFADAVSLRREDAWRSASARRCRCDSTLFRWCAL